MKSSTLHVLIGVGCVLTAVAAGVSAKLASDKIQEIEQVRKVQDPSFTGLTKWERTRVYLAYEAAPAGMAIATCVGIWQSHKAVQEVIEIAANVSAGAATFINGYREVVREANGKNKEAELYSKAVQEKTMPKEIPKNLIIGDNQALCMIVSPGFEKCHNGGLYFVSNATKIKESTLDFNNMWIRRVTHSNLNDANASVSEWLEMQGVKVDNPLLDHLGWSYQHDGTINVWFEGGLSDNNEPILGIVFDKEPHYIN